MEYTLRLDPRCWCSARAGTYPDIEKAALLQMDSCEFMLRLVCRDVVHKNVFHLLKVPMELVYGVN